jgi:hypothetical protein
MNKQNAKPQEKNTYGDYIDEEIIGDYEEIIIEDPDQENLIQEFKKLTGNDDAIAMDPEKKFIDIDSKIAEQKKKIHAIDLEILPLQSKIDEYYEKKFYEVELLRMYIRQRQHIRRNTRRLSRSLFMREYITERQIKAKNEKDFLNIKNSKIDGECDMIKKNGNKCHATRSYECSKKTRMNICKYVFFSIFFIMFY